MNKATRKKLTELQEKLANKALSKGADIGVAVDQIGRIENTLAIKKEKHG